MVNLSVCVETFWADAPFEQKIRNAAKLGFKNIEFWNYSDKDIDAARKALDETGIKVAGFCMEPNYCMSDRSTRADILAGFPKSVEVARKLGADKLIVTTGNLLHDESYAVTRRRIVSVLKELGKAAEDAGICIILEPLNTIVDHAGYLLDKMPDAVDIVDEVDSPAVKILMDIYHQQIMEGNIIANIRRYIDVIGHFHCAGVPGRHELSGGDLDYRSIFKAIDETGYTGYVGLELFPEGDSDMALKQALELLT